MLDYMATGSRETARLGDGKAATPHQSSTFMEIF
uniref:Uncharacterized protein n=1 Tax=Zea mays TaxID=4577 RepID=C4J3D4_MAIZE|nr:unknown [Zea mays]